MFHPPPAVSVSTKWWRLRAKGVTIHARRTYVRIHGAVARRVPRGALPKRPEPRPGDAVRLVAQPVHGLRPPLHVLLRPRLRAPRRPALRRPLRHVDPRQDQRRRGAPPRARPAVVGARVRRDRRRHRPVPAGRGPLPADPRLHRGARRGAHAVQHHHARPDDRPRRRRARRGARAARASRSPSRSRRSTRRSGAGPSRRPRRPRQRLRAVATLVDAGIKAGVGMAPILPGISDRPEQLREVVQAAREAGATGVWANLLYLRPGTREHFLEHLAQDWPELLPALPASCTRSRAYLPADEPKPVRAPGRAALRRGTGRRRPPASVRPSRPREPRAACTRSLTASRIQSVWPCPKPPAADGKPRSPA